MQQETSINAILVRISSPSTSTGLSPVGPMADAVCFFGGQKTRFHDIDSFEPSSVNLKVLGDSCLPNPNKLVAFCKGVLPKSPDASGHQKKNETVPVFETTCKTDLPDSTTTTRLAALLPWKDLLHPTTLTTLQETNIARKIHPFWMVSIP